MAIADDLQRIIDAKADIKTAIENKGVIVGNDLLDTYASKIDSIPTGGGGEPTGDFKVMFWDYDGTLLKEEYVNSGESATPPANPSHQYLLFQGWNVDYTNITRDTHTGALYNTENDWTYAFVNIPEEDLVIGFQIQNPLTINWGDGSGDILYEAGVLTYTYASAGEYVVIINEVNQSDIRISNPSANFFYKVYANGKAQSNTPSVLYRGNKKLNYLVLAVKGASPSLSFGSLTPAKIIFLVVPNNVTTYSFNNCYSVKGIIMPFINEATANSQYYFTYDLKYLNLEYPFNLKNHTSVFTSTGFDFNDGGAVVSGNLQSNVFYNVINLDRIKILSGITTIATQALRTQYVKNIVIEEPVPPSLVNGALGTYDYVNLTIYVPDESVSAYKTATNWVTYRDVIKPMSAKPSWLF